MFGPKITPIEPKEIVVDGENVGTADVIISDRHGDWYGVDTGGGDFEKLSDNGPYIEAE